MTSTTITTDAERLVRARSILADPNCDAAPALALELVAGDMPTEQAQAALLAATKPADMIATAKAMGLA